MKKIIRLFWQIPSLTIGLFICFVIGGMLSGLSESGGGNSESDPAAVAAAAQTAGLLLLSCFITVLTIAFLLIYSQWRGLKLILAVFVLYFGIGTFMTQIESLFFNSALAIPTEMQGKIILSGFIIAMLFAPLSVWVMGKMRGKGEVNDSMPLRQLLSKGLLLSFIYCCVYILFGYFIAWQSPAVRLLYQGNSDILPFGQHMTNMVNHSPVLIFFQLFRGVLWAGLAWLVIQMTEGSWWIKGIIIGLLFGVMATGGLLLPNPYMPAEVRWIHLWETSTSNFLFGFAAGWILRWPKVKHMQDPLTSG